MERFNDYFNEKVLPDKHIHSDWVQTVMKVYNYRYGNIFDAWLIIISLKKCVKVTSLEFWRGGCQDVSKKQ